MDYYHINSEEYNGETAPIVMKVSKRASDICSKMSKLSNQMAKLDRELLEELAKNNNTSTDEVSDIMAFNDFLVDTSQYGINYIAHKQVSKEEYERLLKVGIEAGSMWRQDV